MNILQVSTYKNRGGAARVAWDLFNAYNERGHTSMLAVGFLGGGAPPNSSNLFQIQNDEPRTPWARAIYALPRLFERHKWRGETRLRNILLQIAEPRRARRLRAGFEDFDFPGTGKILHQAPNPPDILHCHNLHGYYFDLRELPTLSQRLPVILTLHDMWTFTGHCAYSIDCDRWKRGCGQCPSLKLYPAVSRDKTAENFELKRDIYKKSQLVVSGASEWIIKMAQSSILGAKEYRVMPYGIDLEIFNPNGRKVARDKLGLPSDCDVILFAATHGAENPYKDVMTIRRVSEALIKMRRQRKLVFIILGDRRDRIDIQGNCEMRYYKFRSDPVEVAEFYKASDVFLHAAVADTFPNTILEAQACGVPVIGTKTGGIPEQIEDAKTGFLVPVKSVESVLERVIYYLDNPSKREEAGWAAAARAKKLYNLDRQAEAYLEWYEELRINFGRNRS